MKTSVLSVLALSIGLLVLGSTSYAAVGKRVKEAKGSRGKRGQKGHILLYDISL